MAHHLLVVAGATVELVVVVDVYVDVVGGRLKVAVTELGVELDEVLGTE